MPAPDSPHASAVAPIAGADTSRELDAVFVNAPLRDYSQRPRVNDFTLPVLGMAYIATYAAGQGFNVGVLDAEALGLTPAQVRATLEVAAPRWVAMNLLAPTYEMSANLAAALPAGVKLMVGGHHAKALPQRILKDARMGALEALVIGEGETRVAALLSDHRRRSELPAIMWRDRLLGQSVTGIDRERDGSWLAPDVNRLPFVSRTFLMQDPTETGGRLEANMVGARGCPYDCTFCGAAVSANPDVTIRVRAVENILAEMEQLRNQGVTAFRFVDDLFLGARRVIKDMSDGFAAERVGDWAVWDATGRINVLDRLPDAMLEQLARNGLREVALGIESGSERILDYVDKRITPAMTESVVSRLVARGINVKGYFIVGFPTETVEEIDATVALIRRLWRITANAPGRFRASIFEYRPYPGTPDWTRLLTQGNFTVEQLLNYSPVDLTGEGTNSAMLARDEFNFSVNLPLAAAPIKHIRGALMSITSEQHERLAG
jgi:anaerobic magnesium-protoporphyrin IX monomethyl ester cyclase